ncbi:MAG TPA: TetR/AcrR family transcriptional regulator [Caulobacteraceae bacterium]
MTLAKAKPFKTQRKPRGAGHLRRGEILIAAESIFLREGYQGTTIRKIAEEVGVSSAALYIHFTDRAAILLAICENALSVQLASNNEIAIRPLDSASKVRLMLEAYMRFGLENPNAYRLVYMSRPVEGLGATSPQLRSIAALCYECFRSEVANMEADGLLPVGKADLAAHILWSACHGLVALRICQIGLAWEDTTVLMDAMLDSVFNGLVAHVGAWSPGAASRPL